MLVLKPKHILDPMWITKKNYIDSEYFNYVLLAAQQKYTKELESGNNEYFYENFISLFKLKHIGPRWKHV